MAKYKIIPSSRTIVQSPISIGHKAEKGVEAIEFDLTAWVETYGSGTLTVIMRRWGDTIPYPIALEIDEDNKATWTLSDIDTAKAGMAYAQLSYIVGETVVKKSDIYTFRVMDSLTGEGEPPEAYESWLEHLTHFAAEAMAEVLDIKGIVTDKTLTVDGGIADAKTTGDELGAINESLGDVKADLNFGIIPNNSYNLIPHSFNGSSGTDNGVGFTFSEGGSTCALSNTATALANKVILNYTSGTLPFGMKAGESYIVQVENLTSDIFVRLFFMNGSNLISGQNYKITETITVTVPSSGCNGVLMRVEVKNGTVTNRTIKYKILNAETLQDVTAKVKANNATTLSALKNENAYDYMGVLFNGTNHSEHGIDFAFSGTNSCLVNGTADATAVRNVINYTSGTLPSGLVAGGSYVITGENIDNNVFLRLFFMNGTSIVTGCNYPIYTSHYKFTIPSSGVNGIVLRIEVKNGAVVNNRTVKFRLLNTYSNQLLSDLLENVVDGYGDYYAFGDSLTKGSVNATHTKPDIVYPEMVARVCNLTLHNMGIGGQGLIMSQGGEKTLAYETVSATDVSTAKLITLAWGTNDTPSSALGTASDASGAETVCGQMKAILDYIFTNNPTCQVIIIGMPRSSLAFDEDGAGGWSRDDFQSVMETIGRAYCVPFVSYHDCSICNEANWNAVTSSSDRVHPNNAAYYITSAYLAGRISSYFST